MTASTSTSSSSFAASFASSFTSSFASSSSRSHPPSYVRSFTSPADSGWAQASGNTASTAPDAPGAGRAAGPQAYSSLPLDLGPPGFNATITLFPETADEHTVYLGPWQVVGPGPRRILWQCSYQNEVLEHFLPPDNPLDTHPHTLHSRHRGFNDPSDMERHLSFHEPHRIRYTNNEGVCTHDCLITAKYEFVSVALSVQFQGDLRRKQLVGFYDVDVVWTDKQSRTDAFGNVRGIGAIQRLKLWRDNYTALHTLTILANKTDKQYHEYHVRIFDSEPKREDHHRRARLNINSRRGSASADSGSSLASLANRIRPGARASRHTGRARIDFGASSAQIAPVDIRHLDFQFTSREGYHQFLADWPRVHDADRGLDVLHNHRGIAGSVSSGISLGAGSEGDPISGAREQAEFRAAEPPPG